MNTEAGISVPQAVWAILGWVRPYWRWYYPALALAAAGAGVNSVTPFAFGWLTAAITSHHGVARAIDAAVLPQAVAAALTWGRDRSFGQVAGQFGYGLGERLTRKILDAQSNVPENPWFAMGPGIEAVQFIAIRTVGDFAGAATTTVVGIATSFAINWRIGLLVVGAAPPITALVLWLARHAKKVRERHSEALENLQVLVDSVLTPDGRWTVAALSQKDKVLEECRALLRELSVAAKPRWRFNYSPLTMATGALLMLLGINGALQVGSGISAVVTYMTLTIQQVGALLNAVLFVRQVDDHLEPVTKVYEILTMEEESGAGVALPAGEGRLTVRGATIGYANGPTPLQDLDLDLAPGEVVVFVAQSGVGKSTLFDCFALRPRGPVLRAGSMTLDGQPLKSIPPWAVRRRLVRIPQETVIRCGTLLDNLFLPDDLPEDEWEEVALGALRTAGLGHWACEGLDRQLVNPSGGEKNRLAMARMLAHTHSEQSRHFFLDEPSAALDPKTIREVMPSVLDEVRKRQKGLSLITHDPFVAQLCDRAIVLVDGRVVEDAPPSELAANLDSHFASILGLAARLSSSAHTAVQTGAYAVKSPWWAAPDGKEHDHVERTECSSTRMGRQRGSGQSTGMGRGDEGRSHEGAHLRATRADRPWRKDATVSHGVAR